MKRVTHLLNHSFNFGVFVNFLDEGSNTKCVGNTNLNNNNNNNKRQQSFVLQCAWIIHVLYVLVDWMRTASLCNPKPSVFSLTIGCVLLTVSAWQRKVTQLPINPVVLLSHNCPTLFPLPSIISLVLLSHNCLHCTCVLLFKVCHAMELNHSTDLEIQYSPGIFSFSHYHCGHTGMEASFPCQITSGVRVQLPCQHL